MWRELEEHARQAILFDRPFLLGQAGRSESRRLDIAGERGIKRLCVEARDAGIVKDQNVVGVDVESGDREVGGAGQDLHRRTVLPLDDNLVMLVMAEMSAFHALRSAALLECG